MDNSGIRVEPPEGNPPPAPRKSLWPGLAAVGVLALIAGVGTWWLFLRTPRLPKPGEPAYEEYVEAFEAGTAAMDSGLWDVAEEKLTRAINLAPGEPAAWANRGLTHLRSSQRDKAKADLTRAAQLAPNNPDVEEMLSLYYEEDRDKAIEHLKKALESSPDDERRLFRLARLIELSMVPDGDAQRMEIFDRLVRRRPTSLPVLAARAGLAVQLKDRKALADVFARMDKLAPSWLPETRERYAKVKEEAKGDFDAADFLQEVELLKNLLKAEPGYARSGRELDPNPDFVGSPLRNFLRLSPLRTSPDEPDLGLTFEAHKLCRLLEDVGKADVIVPFWPDGNAGVRVLAASAKGVSSAPKITLPPFPSGEKKVKPSPAGVLAIDLNNDGKSDLVLAGAGGLLILRQTPGGAFEDVTAAAKLPDEIRKGDYYGAWAADVDLDGDLDVILALRDGGLVLLVNNANGTFTARPFFPGVKAARAFVWADLDNDGAADAALLDSTGRLHVFMNERYGQFTKLAVANPDAKYAALAAADVNDDGTFDLVAVTQDGKLTSLSLAEKGTRWEAKEIAKLGKQLPLVPGEVLLQAIDLDSNGAIDLVLRTPKGGAAWLADGKGDWTLLEQPLPPGVSEIFPGESGALTVLSLEHETPACFTVKTTRGYGSDVFRLRAALGPRVPADQRLNAHAIGSELEVRSGSLITKQLVDRPAVHVGLGRRKKIVVARVVWTNGSSQYEFDKPANEPVVIDQRLTGSCPFLFTYDGTKMVFVTDFCWSTPLGLYINAVKRGKVRGRSADDGMAEGPQTTEWLKVRGDQLMPRDGVYDVRVSATLWETHYLDLLSLMVVDHPPDTELHLDERFFLKPTPPRLYLTTPSRPVAKATDHNGDDVTAIVRENDGKYLATAGLGRYQGLTRDHWVTVDVGDVPGEGPLYLLAHGWLQPTDSSLNVAIEQRGGERPTPLTLEVPDGDGWKQHGPPLGFPAGKNKTLVIRLDDKMRKVRLRTNMEIYWDSLRVARGLDEKLCRTKTLTATTADLGYRGVLRMTRESRTSPEIPQYEQVIGGQPWRDLIGYHTRFGDVRELVTNVDDRYVMMNAGDELRLTFTAPEAPAKGWKRDFTWVSDGWTKDGNLNTRYGKTVLPLPSHDMKDYDAPPGRLEDDPVYRQYRKDWQTYHTRYVTPDVFRRGLRAGRERR